MGEQIYFPVFEITLSKRRRRWKWIVCTNEGKLMMQGYEDARNTARYRANSALFVLLSSVSRRLIQAATASRQRNRHMRSN